MRLIKSEPGKLSHNKEALRNIIIGYKADDEFIEKILAIVKSKQASQGVYLMKQPKAPNKASYFKLHG